MESLENQEVQENFIDYNQQFENILEEMKFTQQLQISNLNNTVEVLKIGVIILGLAIGFSVGSLFVRLVFRGDV